MTNTPPALPAWPEKSMAHSRLHYERARADAWEARARLAVEALERLRGIWYVGAHIYSEVDGMADEAAKALAAIGPLPPLPPLPPTETKERGAP